jgi:hypothetical protein
MTKMVKFKFLNKFLNKLSPLNDTKTNKSKLMKSKQEEIRDILYENFTCALCSKLLKNPLSLECGHSYCRLCLADKYIKTSQNKCPECNGTWLVMPLLNTNLNSSIRKLKSIENLNDSEDEENESIVQEFTRKCVENRLAQKKKTYAPPAAQIPQVATHLRPGIIRPTTFNTSPLRYVNFVRTGSIIGDIFSRLITGVITEIVLTFLKITYLFIFGLIIGAFVAILIVSSVSWIKNLTPPNLGKKSFGNYSGHLKYKYYKDFEKWSNNDVQEWLVQLGPWTSNILKYTLVHGLNGTDFRTEIMNSSYQIENKFIMKLILENIKIIEISKLLNAVDFWDFKVR